MGQPSAIADMVHSQTSTIIWELMRISRVHVYTYIHTHTHICVVGTNYKHGITCINV